MKKIILLFTLFVSTAGFSQSEYDSINLPATMDRKHEIKIGAIKLLAGAIFEGTYEYIYTNDLTFGASILANFDREDNIYPENFSATPFARFYFQQPKRFKARGFFVEGFGKYTTGQNYYYTTEFTTINPDGYYNYNETLYKETYNSAALGIAVGVKWLNRSGFVLELLAGAGRSLVSTNNGPEAYFRGDLNLGYRF